MLQIKNPVLPGFNADPSDVYKRQSLYRYGHYFYMNLYDKYMYMISIAYTYIEKYHFQLFLLNRLLVHL